MKKTTVEDIAVKAFKRMGRASRLGKGCYLTPEMIEALAITSLGETMYEADIGEYTNLEPNKKI